MICTKTYFVSKGFQNKLLYFTTAKYTNFLQIKTWYLHVITVITSLEGVAYDFFTWHICILGQGTRIYGGILATVFRLA
jgi:hypothetical protein